MFHACVQRFDGMDEKFLGGELNRALSALDMNIYILYLLFFIKSFNNFYDLFKN